MDTGVEGGDIFRARVKASFEMRSSGRPACTLSCFQGVG